MFQVLCFFCYLQEQSMEDDCSGHTLAHQSAIIHTLSSASPPVGGKDSVKVKTPLPQAAHSIGLMDGPALPMIPPKSLMSAHMFPLLYSPQQPRTLDIIIIKFESSI